MQYVVFAPTESKLPALLERNVTVTHAISRESIAMMLAADELARSGRYPHQQKLQDFLIKRGIFI